jgi:adenylosuccinate lyase
MAAMENVPLWHERDISHSSVERVIAPDATIALDFMLRRMTYVLGNLCVYPENMQRNLEKSGGTVFSEKVCSLWSAKALRAIALTAWCSATP